MWIRVICGRISSASLFCVFREICGSLIKAAWEKFIAEKKLPQNSQNSQKFIVEKKLPQNTQNSQKFIVEKKLPQISRIYTDVSKMFCVFREFCGSKNLCKSVKSVGEYSLPVCSVNYVNSVGGFNIGALSDMLVHFLLWQAAKPSGDKCTPWK